MLYFAAVCQTDTVCENKPSKSYLILRLSQGATWFCYTARSKVCEPFHSCWTLDSSPLARRCHSKESQQPIILSLWTLMQQCVCLRNSESRLLRLNSTLLGFKKRLRGKKIYFRNWLQSFIYLPVVSFCSSPNFGYRFNFWAVLRARHCQQQQKSNFKPSWWDWLQWTKID